MVKILHTSDVHLHTACPERLEGLKEVLKVAGEKEVDLVTIGGDLFDSRREAEILRPTLRELFTGNPFRILACTGNHDAGVYRENLDFGPDIEIIGISGVESRCFNGVRITAVPYQERAAPGLLASLKTEDSDSVQILLLHCTLDAGFAQSAFGEGEEGVRTYFPVSISQLKSLGYDYVLAGHFHARGAVIPFAERGKFIYPGSPCSITRSERGRRQAYLLDLQGRERDRLVPIRLKTHYVDGFRAFLMPDNQEKILKEMEAWLEERKDAAEISLELTGFIVGDEKEFRRQVEKLAAKGPPVTACHHYRTIDEILESDLYCEFVERLAAASIQDKEKVKQRFIEAYYQVEA